MTTALHSHLPLTPTLALFIFLTSATAVTINNLRLSDLAAAIVFILITLNNSDNLKKRLSILLTALFILLSISLSLGIQIVQSTTDSTQIGILNAAIIIINITAGIIFLLRTDSKTVAEIMVHYCYIALIICWSLFILQVILGYPEWIDKGDVAERFSALSKNPNQLALFLLPIPFFSLYCLQKNLIKRNTALLWVLLVILLNAVVIGKALFVAWLFSFSYLFLTGWSLKKQDIHSRSLPLMRIFIVGTIFSICIPLFILLFTGDIPGGQKDQGGIRLALWENGVKAWTDAFFFGHGPGHYSGFFESYENIEAHNFLIDWAGAYGIFGVIVILIFFILIFMSVRHSSTKLMTALLISLVVQMTFHFYARQPVFWLWWIFVFIIGTENQLKQIKDSRQSQINN